MNLPILLSASCLRASRRPGAGGQRSRGATRADDPQLRLGARRSGRGLAGGAWQASAGRECVNTLPTSDAAIPGPLTELTDLGSNGGEPSISEAPTSYETRGNALDYGVMASGSCVRKRTLERPSHHCHADNLVTRRTIDQLDGIFGSERSGGLRGFEWTVQDAGGADQTIRTWRELGVTGQCAGEPIQTYGHGPSGTTRFFQLPARGGRRLEAPPSRFWKSGASKYRRASRSTVCYARSPSTPRSSRPLRSAW